MAQVHEFKTFLYAFCGKRKVQPSYIVEEEDSGFYCEVKTPISHKIISLRHIECMLLFCVIILYTYVGEGGRF